MLSRDIDLDRKPEKPKAGERERMERQRERERERMERQKYAGDDSSLVGPHRQRRRGEM